MLNQETLELLQCPEDGSPLALAGAELVEKLNGLIAAGQLQNAAGDPVETRLDGLLVRSAGDLGYPVVDSIPSLLTDEAIRLTDTEPASQAGD